MFGGNTLEGTVFKLFNDPNEHDRPTIEDHVPWTFGYKLGSPENKKIANKIENFYLQYLKQNPAALKFRVSLNEYALHYITCFK